MPLLWNGRSDPPKESELSQLLPAAYSLQVVAPESRCGVVVLAVSAVCGSFRVQIPPDKAIPLHTLGI